MTDEAFPTDPASESQADAPVSPPEVELILPPEPIETQTTGLPTESEIELVSQLTAAGSSVEAPSIPCAPAIDLSPLVQAIASLRGFVAEQTKALQSQFDREIRAEATREKVVDRLHAELQDYKQDLLLSTLRPVFVDLIQLHDDMGKILAALASGELVLDRLPALIEGFQTGIEDILYRQGVEHYTIPGDAFDPRRQRAVTTTPSPDPSLDRRVERRLRKGFAVGEKVIRPEIVSVYTATPR